MSRRSYRAPLLVTRCDGCMRRRACVDVWPPKRWFCRQCCHRVRLSALRAVLAFGAQGFFVRSLAGEHADRFDPSPQGRR